MGFLEMSEIDRFFSKKDLSDNLVNDKDEENKLR